jgi:hypothetical protein
MNPAATVLADLAQRGVLLEAVGGRLRFDAPAGALSAADRAAIREHKADLLALLVAISPPLEGAVKIGGLWIWRGFIVATRDTLEIYAAAYRVANAWRADLRGKGVENGSS